MIPNLTMMVATYVCFRFIEIGIRELREGRQLMPIFAMCAIVLAGILTYDTLRTGIESGRISVVSSMSDEELVRRYAHCIATSECSAEELKALGEEVARRPRFKK
jgi:RNase P/RNase MRP subunit p30